METTKKLTKSTNKTLCGVCAGIAEFLGLDITLVRIGWVALTLLSSGFPGVLLYIVCALVMPKPDDVTTY